jgi:hypothetical protein
VVKLLPSKCEALSTKAGAGHSLWEAWFSSLARIQKEQAECGSCWPVVLSIARADDEISLSSSY